MTSRPRSYAQTPKHGTSAFRVWSGRMLQHIKIRRKLGLWQVEVLHHRPGKTVDDLRLGQLIRSFRANQQRASLRLRGRASREDPGYIWEEFRVMPRRGEHFVSTQTKFLLGISISACLCSLAYSCSQAVPAAGPTCACGWAHLCQLVGEDKKWDKAGSRPGCVLTVTLGSLAQQKPWL